MNKSSKKWAIGAAIAGVVGYVAGILTAPKSGKETREDIKEKVVETRAEAEKRLKELFTEMNNVLDAAKKKGGEYKGKSKEQLDVLIEKANKAKDKARGLLSAVHEGDAEDEDLKVVISETSEAIKHLKAFLKK